MPAYDLKSLSAYDFELLTRDLLQEHLHLTLETFTPGKDKGIDIRYSYNKRNNIIIQCKHYANSKLSDLLHVLKLEKQKIDLLNPDRYILSTSIGLTPDAKDKIEKLLYPHIRNLSDIIDIEVLNNLIKQFPKVERLHYKLWMTSSEVLKLILHSPIYNRSRIDREMIIKKSKVYVQNKSYGKALKILGKNHYCIISGVPGIGKTTLAEVLCLKYLTRGYELVSVSTNIEDVYKMLDEETKQVFYFDDFLGSLFLEDRLKDNALIKFIEYITTVKNKRFILTTREYILQQAINTSEEYARAQLKKCIVKQEDYTYKIKAYILYNHLYFSGLEENYIKSIIENKRYLEIINHPNYSPRIIEWMTNLLNVRNIPAKGYGTAFKKSLENPNVIWKIAFEQHLKPYSRAMVILLGMLYDNITLNDFAVILRNWNSNSVEYIVEWNILYKKSLKELDGTFIRIEHPSEDLITFHNPSIKDFVLNYIENSIDIALSYLKIDIKYWDQFCSTINILKQKNNKLYSLGIIKIINELLDNIYIPTIEIETIYRNSFTKKNKTMFNRIRFILEALKGIDNSLLNEIYEKLYQFIRNEAQTGFSANYDAYFVFSEIIKVVEPGTLVEEKELIRERIRNASTHKELDELYDIYELFVDDIGEVVEIAKTRFEEITNEYEIEDDLYSLKKTEEIISELADKFCITIPEKLDDLRERISEIEEEENERENDYDEEAMKAIEERRISEKKELLEIDQMFNCLEREI